MPFAPRSILLLAFNLPLAIILPFGSVGCATTPKTKPVSGVVGDASPVRSDEEYASARADYEAMTPTDGNRVATQKALLGYLLREVRVALERKRPEDAETPFKQSLSLLAAEDLKNPKALASTALFDTAHAYEVAFRNRGAHEQVLTALSAQIALKPNDAENKKRFDEVVGWLETATGDDEGPAGGVRVIDDLEAIAKILSSPFVVDQLLRRYQVAKSDSARHGGGRSSLRELTELMKREQRSSAYEIARLLLRIGDAARAAEIISAMRTAGKLRGDETELATLLDKVNARDAQASDWVGLAMYVVKQGRERGSDDRDVSLRVCREGERRFEKAVAPRLCTGQLALSMEQLVIAMKSFEAVRRIDPSSRDAWEALARIYQARLFQVVTEENLDVSKLPAELARVEAFHAEAATRFAQQPLQPGLAGAIFEVGRGYYNAGRITEAEKYLTRSIELDPSLPALELAATVRQKRGDPQRAAVLLERAINLGRGPKEEQLYRRAKLRRLQGDAIEAAGDTAVAEQTRRGAVEDWDVLIDLGLQKEFAAEALLERGKVLYQLGARSESLTSLNRAIDALPDRGSTYADIIAFLIPRGELAEALDAYHRALGRTEVTDYLKVYCSLWIVDLARRSGQPEDPLALAYLRAADGGKWFHDLARWATGRQTEAELIARANTPGRRAESSFYRAMKALREAKGDEAKALWKDVVSTDMMAFFEYDMASMYLHDGAPSHPRLSGDGAPKGKGPEAIDPRRGRPRGNEPAKPQRPSRTEPTPDGSI